MTRTKLKNSPPFCASPRIRITRGRDREKNQRDAMTSPACGSAGRDAQQQLLALIRNFATEKSQGERRVSDLKKRLLELQAELEAASDGLEEAKRLKEAAEHGLRGSEVELSMADASVLALETRARLLQEEVSRVYFELDALKDEEGNLRDEFINEMYELNKKIRNFQETEVLSLKKKDHAELLLDDSGKTIMDGKVTAQDMLKEIEEKISVTNAQLHTLEQKYQEGLRTHDEILQMLADMEKRSFLGEAIIKETKQLQELARQTAESEKVYATVGVEIQKKFSCPACQVNNMGVSEGALLCGGEG